MTAIEFNNVSKQYRLGLVSTKTLSHDIRRFWVTNILGKEDPYLKIGETNDRSSKGSSDYVWALKDIDFKVEQGDVLGIIGKNGAGKSTLLKILSKVTGPTTGTIKARGRIGSLLEVGTGFHQEMTGRENIYMNGAILGMTKAEITRKLDEIIDFSGCERYIDTPVKRYSSGMMVRLGFAVAAHLDPEILVVDEVLAVGDAEFQKKAIGKMQDVSKGEGRTVLFVSHNMGAVRNLCKKGVLLENGMVKYIGRIDDTIELYMSNNKVDNVVFRNIDPEIHDKNLNGNVLFKSVAFVKQNNVFATNEAIAFEFELQAQRTVEECRINATIYTMDDNPIGSVSNVNYFSIKADEIKKIQFVLDSHNIAEGDYYISFSVGAGNMHTGQVDFDVISKVLSFKIDNLQVDSLAVAQWEKSWGPISFKAHYITNY